MLQIPKSLKLELGNLNFLKRSEPFLISELKAKSAQGELIKLLGDDDDRREMLEAARAGAAIEFEITFLGFQQTDVPNKNFVKFKPNILGKFAKSFVNMPLLRDHDQGSMAARAGTVVASKLVPVDNGKGIELTARVTAQWAVVALLEGNLDRFSIGWDHGGLDTIECSLCKAEVFTKCEHFPGEVVASKSGNTRTCEYVFTLAEGIEVSAVKVPAVGGTGISEVQTALTRLAAIAAAKKQPGDNLEKIALALGLNKDADESAILAVIETSKAAKSAEVQAKLAAVSERDGALGKLESLKSKLVEFETNKKQFDVDQLMAEYTDRLPVARDEAGNTVASELETHVRKLALTDIESARGILASVALPIVSKPQSLPDVAPRGEEGIGFSDRLKKMGIKAASFASAKEAGII